LNRYLIRVTLPILMIGLLMGHTGGYVNVPYIDEIDKLLYDTRLRLSAPGGVDDRIVVIAIDESSLEAEGHWPWTRDKLSRLVDRLFSHGVAAVGFDMVFAERDESADVRLLQEMASDASDASFRQRLSELEPQIDRDRMFADALAGRPTVLGYYFDTAEETAISVGALPYAAFEVSEEMAEKMALPRAFGYGANLPDLIGQAWSAGFINNPLIDTDGVVRRAPLLHMHGLDVYESLSLAVAATYLSDITLPIFVDEIELIEDYPPVEGLELASYRIPIDVQGAVLVPYRGPAGSFPYVSATKVINDTLENTEVLNGAIAMIGATAPGLQDIRSTPFGSVYPGVEIHANVVAGILDRSFRWQPAYMIALEMLSVLIFGLMSALILPLLSPIRATVQMLMIFAASVLLNWYLWTVQMHVLPMAGTVITIWGIYVLNMFFGYFFETRTQQHMSELFGQYVPPDLVKEMAHDPRNYSLASQRRELSVLFSDIREFTTISEGLTPAQLSDMLNQYLTPMTLIIHDRQGTIDKYIGDAVMAFWGAPVADPDHADKAVDAAIAMQEGLEELNQSFRKQGLPDVQIGVGINTGDMSVGNMGSRFRRAYTVLGDAVNLASRLEGLTKGYGVGVIVGEATKDEATGFRYMEVDRVRVKGKTEPVTIYQPIARLAVIDDETEQRVAAFEQALASYRRQQWDDAEKILKELSNQQHGNKLYALYLERIRAYREEPPGEGWDGVFTHTSK
jgi:adenylate cyclase